MPNQKPAEKILISACLAGQKVRYDGAAVPVESAILARWQKEGRLIPVCPEVEGGLAVPRLPAEIVGKGGGHGVLHKTARVIRKDGVDISAAFLKGANIALALAQKHDIKIAILKDGSPSNGSRKIYDGSFTGTKTIGHGVTTALLEEHGIKVFSENEIEQADSYLRKLETAEPKPPQDPAGPRSP